MMSRSFTMIVMLMLVGACASKKKVAEAPNPVDVTPDAAPRSVVPAPDAGVADSVDLALDLADSSASAVLDASASDAGAAGGQLCIKAPGTHTRVGKGSSNREDIAAFERRAKKVNAGMTFRVDGREATARADEGAVIRGLDLGQRHRVAVAFVNGGTHQGFSVRFPDGESRMCAFYNSFYDNWRLRPVGKRGCGPCPAD